MRRTSLLLLVLCLAAAAPAQAETVTLGPDVNNLPVTGNTGGTSLASIAQTTGAVPAAPFDGTVDRWRIAFDSTLSAGACTASCKLSLQILRPNGQGSYESVYDGVGRDLTASGVFTFEEVVPVLKGDLVGIKQLGVTGDGVGSYNNGVAVDTASRWTPPLIQNGGLQPPNFTDNLKVLLVNADFTRTVSPSQSTPAQAETPTPAPPAAGSFPQPTPAQSATAVPAGGTVLVRRPGSSGFTELQAGQVIPNGSVVDARKGTVLIITATDMAGGFQYSFFYEGVFRVTQTAKNFPITEITLVQKLPFRTACPSTRGARASRRPPERHVWGQGKGRFRTHGNNASAIVRGTRWLTSDRCAGTLVRVKEGLVGVRDEVRRRTVAVPAGKSYLARG